MRSASPAGAGADTALAEQFAAAVAQHRAGALADAERRYRDILARFPDHAESHGMLGVALSAQHRIDEALAHFERAAALKPDVAGTHDDLARAYMMAGNPQLAVEAAARALELDATQRRSTSFAHCAKFVVFKTDSDRYRRLLLRALVEGWARPRELAHACISLIALDLTVREWTARAVSAWPARLPATALWNSPAIAALAHNELLCRLLEIDPVTDLGLERLLTNVRSAMLESAAALDAQTGAKTGAKTSAKTGGETGDGVGVFAPAGADEGTLLGFCSALARQCFINEYVFSTAEAEAVMAERLRGSLDQALASGRPVPPHCIAAVGAYFPLRTLNNVKALLERSWPPSVNALLVQQVKEPAQELEIAATIPVLTAIDGEVSRAVRQQYEENPYPRWTKAGPPGQPAALDSRQPDQPLDVLIAGCGTGLSATEFAQYVRSARILAIDLSRASLSYAKRMAQNIGLTNIEFAQADITKLGAIGRAFDFIDASGVLHHLADPWEGWRILLSLLRPRGTMEVGLYSEQARRNVVAARAMIAQRGYRPTPEDIRRCREDIAAAASGSLLHSLTLSDDFYSTSECRDLLFHPQEHRLTLPNIKAFLAANNLQFLGFALAPPALQKFAARFPAPSAMTDLDCWHAFELEAPATFAGMYLFSVRKPATGPQSPAARPD